MKRSALQGAWVSWEHFWFDSVNLVQVRLFRKLIGWILFGCYFSRSFDLEFFYSDAGMLRSTILPEVISSQYKYSLLTYFSGITSIWVLHLLFLLSLMALAFGMFTRFSAIFAFILHVSFLHRNWIPAYGVDSVATVFLFYLSFADRRVGRSLSRGSSLASVAFRFMQIQVCVIYAYAGYAKLHGPHWISGEALWYVLANPEMTWGDFSWISQFPWMIQLLTYATVLWELSFSLLIWIPWFRLWILGVGALLHLFIACTLRIPYFSILMVSTYFLFLKPNEIRWLTQGLLDFFNFRLKSQRA